ncbi:MAG: hypothetical protein NC408_08650 [Candidatus Gastranaerophilales bacterium]|nr:hypothetical protein [Candidatus Gastranaerophilales bacterium]MCM1073389.1 hypothetical protein [Bacteroides sp.]
MDFGYYDKNNQIRECKINIDDNWQDIKTDNELLNSIFDKVDNGDGIVQEKEINYLNNLIHKVQNFAEEVINNNHLKTINEMLNQNEKKQEVHSEGLDRHIREIKLSDNFEDSNLADELRTIASENGFEISFADSNSIWIEDSSIRLADGRVYITDKDPDIEIIEGRISLDGITRSIEQRKQIVKRGTFQGIVGEKHSGTYYAQNIPESNIVHSNTYLEGGNVLNTCLKDGTPAAIIGEESIIYTLKTMGLKNTPENIEIAKAEIAKDLGLKPENITYIKQADFHIDMLYRPLHNGQIAIPDYDEGIRILQETDIADMSPEEKDKLLQELIELRDNAASILQDAENTLSESGYEIIRVPCFFNLGISDGPQINYMNGVGGTNPDNKTFYITNSSNYEQLDQLAEEFFKQNGVDNVYFVHTGKYLKMNGGIDCLTQEY